MKNPIFEKINFRNGNITYNSFILDPGIPLSKQKDDLEEDMMQVCYPHRFTLDLGWLPSHNLRGAFSVVVVRNYNWEKPVFQARPKTIDQLIVDMQKAADCAFEMSTELPIKNFLLDAVDFKNGEITFDDFRLDKNISIYEQQDALIFHMMSISYPDTRMILIGSEPEGEINGTFVIDIIQNYDPENSIYHSTASTFEDLIRETQKAIDYCVALSKSAKR